MLLVAALFPVSFFSEAGRLLNREVRLLGPARAGTTWKARWSNEVSGAWHCLSSSLLATQGTYSGTSESARENERRVRASVIYMIVAFTLNPSDTALHQGPLARICSRGMPSLSEILGILNTMGVSISGRKLQLDAPLRIRESNALKLGLLKAWLAPFVCPDGTMVFRGVKIHLDNWDKNFIHVLLAGMTVLNPRSLKVFLRNRLRELTVHQLITETPEEEAAAMRELILRAESAVALSNDEESNAAVKELVENEQIQDELIAEEKMLRQSTKLGRKRGTQEEDVEQRFVIASRDFDGGEPVGGYPGITFKAGEVLKLLYLMPPKELAAAEKGEGPHRQSGYVHYRYLAGYGGGESSSSSGHIHTPAKDVLARNARRRHSLEDDRSASVLPINSDFAAEGEEADAAVEGAAAEDEDAADEEDEDLALGESKILKLSDADLKRRVNTFLDQHPELPGPMLPLTSVFHGLCPGLASNLDDARAVIEETMKVIKAAAGRRHGSISVSVDGQEFLAEMTARDKLRMFYQSKVDELERELKLGGRSAVERAALFERKEAAEAMRDAVSDMTFYELGMLHAEFVLVRGLWKKYNDAAYAGLLDRIGLGPLHDYVRECRAGSLHLSIEFFELLVESYLTEIAVLQREEEAAAGCDHIDVLSFISITGF